MSDKSLFEVIWKNISDSIKQEPRQEQLNIEDVWKDFEQNGIDAGPYYPENETNKPVSVIGTKIDTQKRDFGKQLFTNMQSTKKQMNGNGANKKMDQICVFCKNNGVPAKIFKSHNAKTCPRLQSYTCPTCYNTGHTVRYCPQKKIITPEDIACMA